MNTAGFVTSEAVGDFGFIATGASTVQNYISDYQSAGYSKSYTGVARFGTPTSSSAYINYNGPRSLSWSSYAYVAPTTNGWTLARIACIPYGGISNSTNDAEDSTTTGDVENENS
jgi:hypothetical protein